VSEASIVKEIAGAFFDATGQHIRQLPMASRRQNATLPFAHLRANVDALPTAERTKIDKRHFLQTGEGRSAPVRKKSTLTW
jgi:hypothetical protein